MTDYLEVVGMIIARLREQLPHLPVSPTWSLAEIKESPDLAPALFVLLDSDLPGDSSALGRCHKVEQRWAVLVVVRADEGIDLFSETVKNDPSGTFPGSDQYHPRWYLP